ncbi:MAG: hypothetical protein Q8941_23740, partial [Bacteroidota bacterium]|nr:hypothetical protein [Bacteroidota bacterium]
MLRRIIDYLVNDLGVNRDTAVTIVVSLLTFASGYLITGSIKLSTKWKKQLTYKKILRIIISDFLKLCKKQRDVFEAFSKESGFTHGNNFNISTVPNFSHNYLTSVDVNVFIENFSLFFSKKRATQISEFFELVETVKSSKAALRENINMAFSSYNSNLITYNQNLHSLERFKDSLWVEFNGKPLSDNFIKYLDTICNSFIEWGKNGKSTNIHNTYTQIIQPILENLRLLPPNHLSHQAISYCLLA